MKISNSCLRDKMCICNQIFVKLAQFVYLIIRFNPMNFEKNPTNCIGKVAISSLLPLEHIQALQGLLLVIKVLIVERRKPSNYIDVVCGIK